MRTGAVIPTFETYTSRERFAETVQAIEELGFHSAWFGDHIAFRADRPEYLGSSWMDAVACACVGLGMTLGAHLGPRARSHLEHADVVFAAVGDPLAELWLQDLHRDVRSLQPFYAPGKPRHRT